MIANIINGIAATLHASYPNYPIYTQKTPQHLTEPAFHIRLIQPRTNNSPGGTWERRDLVEIDFFPADPKDTVFLYEVYEEIGPKLKCIEDPDTGSRFRMDGISGDVSDGVLVITGTFTYYEIEIEDTDGMKTLEVTGNVE